MKPFLTRIAVASAALLGSLLVAGCGGGASADTTPAIKISSVKVFGDSLQDSGTFGYKFTVQSPDNLIYAERIAANYGQTLCNFFVFTGTTFAANTAKTGCTNFAIGGGRITYTGAGGAANPLNVGTQMATYASAAGYTASDLVIIDGGGNDAADLVGAYLAIPKDGAQSYSALLGTLLTPAQIGAALQGGAATVAQIGGTYMTALADKFAAQIKASVLDKGATHVIVMNVPDVTITPRFQMVLDSIAQASGGGSAGATARAQSQALFQGWMTAFNTELAAKFAGNDSVIVVDFYKGIQDEVASPAQFGLSNVKTPACPITGLGSDGLPVYDFPSCTAAALSAAPPAGVSGGANWWKSYAFSDSFHPTPYGHQLTQQLIAKSLATKGWL
ncbi:SGNH/GDSL hydrolase family protein [Roseateles sp.]|uniref:SGNH/GDSL hydrolase family protein n=1 Tax=Roseateles sp. TaxID=1971397 RepID=UPI0025E25214|nr:SGNH/GDSL hydrolase family protein [Roseateles sp.]MBV8033943.1 SGNH/GDSL hydrolase family protein [Roseateles sp.]